MSISANFVFSESTLIDQTRQVFLCCMEDFRSWWTICRSFEIFDCLEQLWNLKLVETSVQKYFLDMRVDHRLTLVSK